MKRHAHMQKRSREKRGWFQRFQQPDPPPGASVNYATSPLLASKTPPWRSKLLVALIAIGFAGLAGRAVYIQVIGTDFYQKQGEARYARRVELPASRGRIVDRNGQVLATSVPAPSVWAIPKDFEADPAQRKALAKLLGLSGAELAAKVDDEASRFAWLARQVDEQVALDVKELGVKGVHQVREYKRKYPEGEAAAQIVGFTNLEERGQEGIELAYQTELAGRGGSRNVIRDRLGRIVEDTGNSVAPVDGQDIQLSIDSKVQFYAYQRVRDAVIEHKAKAGSVVAIDVQTGEVLALANYPSYKPGDRSTITPETVRNRALTDTFEPGSTMKPFVVSIALETNRVRPDTVIGTKNFVVGGKSIRDAHVYEKLTVAEVIQKSSNIGTVKMAMTMEPREMYEMFSAVGLGQKPQIGFPGTVTGRLRPYKTWKPVEQATMAYGYGLSTSLFQLARAYTVFARDGELIPNSLLKHDPAGLMATVPKAPPVPSLIGNAVAAEPPVATGTRVMSAKTAQTIRDMLQMAAGPGGTAPMAQALGYSVGGKSGTAHKQEGKGYAGNKYRSWFVGMAPIKHPRIVVAVMIDEPSAGKYFGGSVAGPVFSGVVQNSLRMMGVAPDLDVQSQIVAKEVPAVEESF